MFDCGCVLVLGCYVDVIVVCVWSVVLCNVLV